MSFIVKNTTFPSLLDLLAPHSCHCCGHTGEALCSRCKNNLKLSHQNYCPNCKNINHTGKCQNCKDLPPIFVVGKLDELIGELVHSIKYESIRALALPLAKILDGMLPQIVGPVSLVPLPTIPHHIRERGLDHTLLIMKKLKQIRGNNYHVEKLLIRINSSVQVGSDAKTRILQAQSAYSISKKATVNPETTYLLFDDVWTTGASMKAALKKLREAGAKKIIIAVLAVNSLN